MADTTIFSGSSRYSSDFQSVIDRAVSIASLPITLLSNQETVMTAKQSAYGAIGDKLAAVRGAMTSLKSATGTSSYSALNTKPEVATAAVSTGAMTASYTINVVDEGAYTRLMSSGNLEAELQAGTGFTLTVNGAPTTIEPAEATITSLASAINAAQAGVQASVINLGSSSAPSYRLSLQSTAVDDVAVTLDAGAGNLVDSLVQGHKATYQVNGQPPVPIESDSRSVTVAPGLVMSLAAPGETRIDVVRNSSAVAAALGSLVTAYNAAMGELDKYRGEDAGILAGDSQLWSLTTDLRGIVNFGDSGTVRSLANLGLSFDKDGKLSLDSTALSKVSMSDIDQFLGDGTTPGFLKNAGDLLDAMSGSGTGIIDTTQTSLTKQISTQESLIAENQRRVDDMEQSLTAKMAAADALIASLEQQVSYFTGLFAAMKTNSESNR